MNKEVAEPKEPVKCSYHNKHGTDETHLQTPQLV